MRKYNLISGVIWLILAIFLCLESLRLGIGKFQFPDAGFFPLLTAIFMGLFSVFLLLEATIGNNQKKEAKIAVWSAETRWKKIILTLLALVIYSIVLEKIGYLLSTFVLMLFLFKTIEPQKWSVAVLGAIITVLLSYLVFNVWLKTQFPVGELWEYF
ncbi:MAG: tripartite tricarboxylate transporter TctB family protein [Nitrospirota bacterium]